jgi:hypothetical protein
VSFTPVILAHQKEVFLLFNVLCTYAYLIKHYAVEMFEGSGCIDPCFLDLGIGGLLYTLVVLTLGKQPLVPIEQETGLTQEQVSMIWRSKNS